MMKSSPPSWEHQNQAGTFIEDKPGAMLAMEMGTGKDLDDIPPSPPPKAGPGWETSRPDSRSSTNGDSHAP